MTQEDQKKIYAELSDLSEEFLEKWRKTDFRYRTEFNANKKCVNEIINKSVNIIRYYKELNELMFANKDDNYKIYMETTGFWVDSIFHSYMNKIMEYIEN